MVDKLTASDAMFKEMQMRMGDPDVAADAAEFQKVAKAAADLEATSTAFATHRDIEKQVPARAFRGNSHAIQADPQHARLVSCMHACTANLVF